MRSAIYIIRCRVSGGVTGTRESIFKNRGGIVRFDNQHDAQREADRLVRAMNHEFAVARFDYWVDVADWNGARRAEEVGDA